MRKHFFKVSLTCFIFFLSSLCTISPPRSTKATKSSKQYLTDDFDVDSYISVKDKEQWYKYLADFSKIYNQENTSVWRTVNPIVCYLAVRVFPLEYVDEVQKVFVRLRFSSNCGNRKDVIFMSPIIEDNPYDMKSHPQSLIVISLDPVFDWLTFSSRFSTLLFLFRTEREKNLREVTPRSPKKRTKRL